MNDIQTLLPSRAGRADFWRSAQRALMGLLLLTVCSLAEAQNGWEPGGFETGLWVGGYEVDRPDEAVEVGFDVTINRELILGIRPTFGLLVTSDESLFAFSGFRYTLPLNSRRFRVDISSALGLFEDGDGKQLGGVVEFRSGLDLMTRLTDRDHLSLAIYHISNAGIYERNPGSNTVLLRWVRRFGR